MRIIGFLLLIVCVPLLIRGLQVGVEQTAEGVVVRKLTGTRRVPWSDFVSARVSRTSSLVPWWIVVVERRSGKPINVPEVCSFGLRRSRPLVDTVVDALNSRRGAAGS